MNSTPLPYERRHFNIPPYKGVTNYRDLSKADREELWKQANATNSDVSAKAKEVLINLNLPLMIDTVNNVFGPRLEKTPWHSYSLEDCIGEGYKGLVKAIENFKPQSGNQFSTYATFWIRSIAGRALTDHENLIRIPESVRGEKRAEQPRSISSDELDEKRGWNLRDGNTISLVDREQDLSAEADVSEFTSGRFQDSEVRKCIDALPTERQRVIIRSRYGIGCQEKTLKVLSKELGISVERIRQIEVAALQTLRRMMEAAELAQ